MAKDKKLALAFQFSEAPDEVKAIAQEHADNLVALEKAQYQAEAWQKELEQDRAKYAQSNSRFEKLLDKWLQDLNKKREELP